VPPHSWRHPVCRTCPTVLGVKVHFVARINIRAQSSPAFAFMRDEGTPTALAPACGLARRQQWPSRSPAALWSASIARHRSLACSADIGLHQGTAIVTRCPLPAHPVGRRRHRPQTAPAALRYWNKAPQRNCYSLARYCPACMSLPTAPPTERRTPARKPRFSTYSAWSA
jgi:hypothetical protein